MGKWKAWLLIAAGILTGLVAGQDSAAMCWNAPTTPVGSASPATQEQRDEQCQLLRYFRTQSQFRHGRAGRPTGGAGLGRHRGDLGVAHGAGRQRARFR